MPTLRPQAVVDLTYFNVELEWQRKTMAENSLANPASLRSPEMIFSSLRKNGSSRTASAAAAQAPALSPSASSQSATPAQTSGRFFPPDISMASR